MDRKKILVVDDNRLILKVLSFRLTSLGYQVMTAEDGSEAVNKFRKERPDLLVLDISFPPDVAHGGGVAWDGFLILDWIRRLDENRRTPVFIISSSNQEQHGDKLKKASVDGFFKKGNEKELLDAVKNLLGTNGAAKPDTCVAA